MLKMVRWIRKQKDIPPSRIWNFDEIRIYSSPQDLHSRTLEFASVHDPVAMKIANPKEGYTGIIMGNGDGSTLMVFLVTTKALPADSVVHTVTLDRRTWENGGVKVTPVSIFFAVICGIVVLKVPPGGKAWCSAEVTQSFLEATLFLEEGSLVQVNIFLNRAIYVLAE